MDLTDSLLITKSQQVNSQEVDFQKKTEDTFPSKFHKNKASCGLLAVNESRCTDHQLQCENNIVGLSLETQIAENSSINVSRELKPHDHTFPKDKQTFKQISDELRKSYENINKVQNIKKSQSVENFEKCSEINLANKCLYTNLNTSPKERNALDKQAMFIKFHSLELCTDKVCSLHIHENFCTDIHKCVVDSESNKPNKMKKCLDYESVKRYPCKVSNEPPQHNTASKPQILYETRPIYPNVPYSPYSTPFSSPRSSRRKPAFRESRRISIDKSGSFLQLNQYRLMEQIGQVI